jgi:indolepyruvate ferredoxin oxidoreductase
VTKTVVTLDDKYAQEQGQVFLSSLQALVRLPLDQARRDRARGLASAGYVTGYRGSPITTLDAQLWAAEKILSEHHIRFEPGLNEELAATSLRGTQQVAWFGKPKYDGVFAMWYAKGVGVDRACEALKMANFEGASATGGVLVVAGDDHAAKSSATAHQSEHTLIAGFIPVLYPATTDEILEFGLMGWEMSRYSGLYVGLKTITDTLDLTSTVALPASDFPVVRPELPKAAKLNLVEGATPLQQEAAVTDLRLPAAQAFARANNLDRIALDAERRELTIVTAGKAYLDVRQALQDLGLEGPRGRAAGIRLVKIGLIWPLEASFAREACAGSREVLVIEEKRPVMEDQLARVFYALPEGQRPAITGKRDPDGGDLLPPHGVLDPGKVRRALVSRLEALGLLDDETRARAEAFTKSEAEVARLSLIAARPAFFCSGCPHNTSTVVPEGSMAMGATGCHGLAAYMGRRTMITVGMGSEGMPWVGAKDFVDTPHMFQNMGDGTFTHSGLLSIRAAVAAKANVTFKLLYNDAVAMTGGQPAEGGLSAETMVRELTVEGVRPVVLVSDEPDKYTRADLPEGVRVLHRDRLDEVQRELRRVRGVSAIVYEQTCANEKRRRRKRGKYPDPDLRLYINPAVCEGCGDCSVQSNCMSVQPLETEFGRKRLIDQSSCNKDYSCIKGFCPSFVTVRGAQIAKTGIDADQLAKLIAGLPTPKTAAIGPGGYSLLVTGIGGTGVLTVGAVLGMAAHLEGKSAKVLDQTGMAQKGGAVTSHIRIGAGVDQIPSARLGTGQADLLVACDLVVASSPEVLATAKPGARMVANDEIAPTGDFQSNAAIDLSRQRFLSAIRKRLDERDITTVHAHTFATRLVGDSIFTNIMMVGFAAQQGLLPVAVAAIEEAVKLNGVAVKANLQAFALGRLAAVRPEAITALTGEPKDESVFPQTLPDMLASRSRHLAGYQDQRYADGYLAFMRDLETRLRRRGLSAPEPFLTAVASQLARLMSYKDEYEVARLYSAPEFERGLREQFAGKFRISLNLAPPLLASRLDAKTGRPAKMEFGGWILPVLRLLQRFKGLRGTPFDPFGHTAERRLERRLIEEFRTLVLAAADRLSDATLATGVRLANSAAAVAGYGPVKDAGVAKFRAEAAELMDDLERTGQATPQAQAVPA